MKRLLAAIGLAALLAAGCGPEDNPFTADPDAGWQGGPAMPHVISWGTLSSGMGSPILNDVDPNTEGLQDAILIQFDDSMDPATITLSAFSLLSVHPDTVTVALSAVEYIEEDRTAVLYGVFDFDRAYVLTAGAGILTDLAGNPLDPNHNNLADGAPWDEAKAGFYNGAAPMPDLVSPAVITALPYGGGVGDPVTWVTIGFENGPIDAEYLTTGYAMLLRTSDSSVVATHVVSSGPASLVIQPDNPLSWGERYTVRVSNDIRDESGNLLDTNSDGYIWPDEPDRLWDFQMADDTITNKTPPTVAGILLDPEYEYLMIEFCEALTGGFVVMDETTFITANVHVQDSEGNVPLEFSVHPAGNRLYCYFQREVQSPLYLWVSAYVRDQYGNFFDGNNDGLGGTPGEDDYSITL